MVEFKIANKIVTIWRPLCRLYFGLSKWLVRFGGCCSMLDRIAVRKTIKSINYVITECYKNK